MSSEQISPCLTLVGSFGVLTLGQSGKVSGMNELKYNYVSLTETVKMLPGNRKDT